MLPALDMGATTLAQVNAVTERVIGAAIQVHRTLGPGLLESVYLACLLHELRVAGLAVETQYQVPVQYGDVKIDCGYKIDVLVEETVVVEVKSVANLAPIHDAQLLTYLRLTRRPVGLLINFNTKVLTNGVRRFINGWLPP